ncbi:MAG: hypothetical protein WBG95_12825 [Sulfitobacter sp.]
MTQRDEFDLEAAFDAARAKPPQMPNALMVRVLADARTVQPRPSLWQRLSASVGGSAGVGGLITATVFGFWMGFAPPADFFDPVVLIEAATAQSDLQTVQSAGWDMDGAIWDEGTWDEG